MTARHLRDLPVFLRAPRASALWLIGVGITVASVVAYVLSYAGLAQWALHHSWAAAAAVWFPFLIDLPLVVCEVILFVAAIDGDTPWRVRALAWLVLLAFTAASTVGNADRLAAASPLARGGFALPPLVLAVVLGFGLGELKRQAAKYRAVPANVPEAAMAEYPGRGTEVGRGTAEGMAPGWEMGSARLPAPAPAGGTAPVAVPVAVPLPSVREIRDRRKCSQATAAKIRAELKLLIKDSPAVTAATLTPGGGAAGSEGRGAVPHRVPATMNGQHAEGR